MKRSILSKTSGLILIAMLATVSCKKDSSNSSTANEQATADLSASATSAETMYDDAFDIVVQSSEQSNISVNATGGTVSVNSVGTNSALQTNSFTTTAGATITLSPLDPSVFPKTMTIDYGAGVTSPNGVTRKGKIVVTLTGRLRVAGSIASITYNNYSVNGYTIAGTYTLTPIVIAGAGVNYTGSISNGGITFPGGQVSSYNGSETFTQTGGIGTATVADDTYAITGNFSYSNSTKGSVSGTITTPLVKTADCKNITSGTVAFVYKGINGTLDFGAGNCDNQATIKVGITTKTVTLPR